MQATLIDSMGTDLTVVNAARVSFNKKSDFMEVWGQGGTGTCELQLSGKDVKLIKYLATHNHTSPFRHCFATIHVKAPIFVARQCCKHQVGMSWNEVSRRYVDEEPELYWPAVWRARSEDKKQGSSDVQMLTPKDLIDYCEDLVGYYCSLIDIGVAPEQARMILPQNTYTEWYWSGSLQAWAHVCNLRCAPDTQQETREVANQIDSICADLWPVSWKELRSNG